MTEHLTHSSISLFKMNHLVVLLMTFLGTFMLVFAGELTFELPDNERQCFHEVIDKGIKCTIEFQVNLIYISQY